MNAAKQQNMLAGQSSLARKVFQVVPIQERWSAHDIFNSLMVAETTGAQFPAVRRGLGELKDAGLIREPVNGHFQRTAITITPQREQSMSKETKPAVSTTNKPEGSALDTLAVLSGRSARLRLKPKPPSCRTTSALCTAAYLFVCLRLVSWTT